MIIMLKRSRSGVSFSEQHSRRQLLKAAKAAHAHIVHFVAVLLFSALVGFDGRHSCIQVEKNE